MTATTPRERLIARLDHLDDEQIESLISYADAITSTTLIGDYKAENDPTVGFLSGSTSLAQRAKEILRDEITSHGGWTQKHD